MRLLQWLGINPARIRIQDSYICPDEQAQAIAREQSTIDRHEAEKQRTRQWIAERKAIAARVCERLDSHEARSWFNQREREDISQLEESIQQNDRCITHARNNILSHQRRSSEYAGLKLTAFLSILRIESKILFLSAKQPQQATNSVEWGTGTDQPAKAA